MAPGAQAAQFYPITEAEAAFETLRFFKAKNETVYNLKHMSV
jgi:hypothetical protein